MIVTKKKLTMFYKLINKNRHRRISVHLQHHTIYTQAYIHSINMVHNIKTLLIYTIY